MINQNVYVATGSINVADVSPVADISGIPGWDMVGTWLDN